MTTKKAKKRVQAVLDTHYVDRGFLKLIGQTIMAINYTAVNSVTFITQKGQVFEINTDDMHMGIPIIRLIEET